MAFNYFKICLQLSVKVLFYSVVKCFLLCFQFLGILLSWSNWVFSNILWRFEILLKVHIWVMALVVLLDEFLTNKELWALIAAEMLSFLLVWLFQQILVSFQSFSFESKFLLESLNLFLLDFLSLTHLLTFQMLAFVVRIEWLSKSFKVILCVNKVLKAELADSEQLYKVSISNFFEIFSINFSVCDVLKNLFNLFQVGVTDNFFNVCVH